VGLPRLRLDSWDAERRRVLTHWGHSHDDGLRTHRLHLSTLLAGAPTHRSPGDFERVYEFAGSLQGTRRLSLARKSLLRGERPAARRQRRYSIPLIRRLRATSRLARGSRRPSGPTDRQAVGVYRPARWLRLLRPNRRRRIARVTIPGLVIILAPNHTALRSQKRRSLWKWGAFHTPLGDVPVDRTQRGLREISRLSRDTTHARRARRRGRAAIPPECCDRMCASCRW